MAVPQDTQRDWMAKQESIAQDEDGSPSSSATAKVNGAGRMTELEAAVTIQKTARGHLARCRMSVTKTMKRATHSMQSAFHHSSVEGKAAVTIQKTARGRGTRRRLSVGEAVFDAVTPTVKALGNLGSVDDEFVPIKSIIPQTFEAIEVGLIRRRDAIYQANMRAIRALEPLESIPPLFKYPRRNRTGKLLPPIECDCTELERDDLACVLWQEEQREMWMIRQITMCASLLRRAGVVLSAMQKKSSIRLRSKGTRAQRRLSVKKASFIRTIVKKQRARSCLRQVLLPLNWVRKQLQRYFSIRSRDAKYDRVSQHDRIAALDKPLAALFCLFCIGPGFLLVYHRVEPFERAAAENGSFSDLRTAFYWWNCMLLLAMFPMFVMSIMMLKHNIDFKVWGYAATRPQSRVMLSTNLVGMILTWVNVCALVEQQLSRLVRAYYCIDALVYYLMLHLLVLRDSMQAKPKYFSLCMYVATIVYSLVSWLGRISDELPVEQSTLIDFEKIFGGNQSATGNDSDTGGKIIVQTIMEAINSSTVVMIGGNFYYIVNNIETVCWAPVRLERRDLQSELRLQVVRRGLRRRLRADQRRGELKAESLDKESERLHRDPAVLEQAVVRIQRHWRSHQGTITFADVAVHMHRLSGGSPDSLRGSNSGGKEGGSGGAAGGSNGRKSVFRFAVTSTTADGSAKRPAKAKPNREIARRRRARPSDRASFSDDMQASDLDCDEFVEDDDVETDKGNVA